MIDGGRHWWRKSERRKTEDRNWSFYRPKRSKNIRSVHMFLHNECVIHICMSEKQWNASLNVVDSELVLIELFWPLSWTSNYQLWTADSSQATDLRSHWLISVMYRRWHSNPRPLTIFLFTYFCIVPIPNDILYSPIVFGDWSGLVWICPPRSSWIFTNRGHIHGLSTMDVQNLRNSADTAAWISNHCTSAWTDIFVLRTTMLEMKHLRDFIRLNNIQMRRPTILLLAVNHCQIEQRPNPRSNTHIRRPNVWPRIWTMFNLTMIDDSIVLIFKLRYMNNISNNYK